MKKDRQNKKPFATLRKGIVGGIVGLTMLTGAGVLTGCGEQGPQGETGPQGPQGPQGAAGISSYVGYDGYIWNGPDRTEFKSTKVETQEDVIESTLGVEKTMSKYFEGAYVDLSENRIALMANFRPTAKITQYGGIKITEITVIAETSGVLHIGTAKVADIVNARNTGATYTATTAEYAVEEGLSTITLNLEVAEDETIVLGGDNSVSLYFAKGVNINDAHGNFTLLNGEENATLLAETNGKADTLALEVKCDAVTTVEYQVFEGMENLIVDGGLITDATTIAKFNVYQPDYAPFAYKETTYFKGKTLSSIGTPVRTVTDCTQDQVLTIFVVKENQKEAFNTNYVSKHQLIIPANTFSSNTVNAWYYFDLTSLNITVGADETLAFFDPADTVVPGYKNSQTAPNRDGMLEFITNKNTNAGSSEEIYWDVKYVVSDTLTIEEIIEILDQKEQEAIDALSD